MVWREGRRLANRWMREAIIILKGAIEKLKRGDEGDFKQALMIADHATETIMRNYLIFKCTCLATFPSILRLELRIRFFGELKSL